jgi:hypothetical protein
MRQFPLTPQKSPSAEVMAQVGVTDINVRYSSPGVGGRKVWGDVVPFGKVWRTGANAPTKISFSQDVTFGGKPVAPGAYTLLTIPTATSCTVILNRDPSGAGAFEYDEKHDVVRFEAPLTDAAPRERLTYFFEDASDAGAKLVLEWAGKRLVMPIGVDTKRHVQKSIDDTLAAAWRPLFNAGRYALENENDPKRALAFLQQSMQVHTSWWNTWWAAQAQQKLGKKAEAKKLAEQARTLGKGDMTFERFFAKDIEKALAEWGKK